MSFSSLYELIEDVGRVKPEYCLGSEEAALEYIAELTGNPGIRKYKYFPATHSLLVYFLGKCMSDSFSEQLDFSSDEWMFTSLFHDVGYTMEAVRNESIEAPFKYSLQDAFEQQSGFEAFSWKEIVEYDRVSRMMHKNRGDLEKKDHGFYGGQLLWDLWKSGSLDTGITEEYSALKCTAAVLQHNIYWAINDEEDRRYINIPKLRLGTDFTYSFSHSLLTWLCLMDTIECSKKQFCDIKDLIKRIMIQINDEEIALDFSSVRGLLSEERKESYAWYLHTFELLEIWTPFRGRVEGDAVRVTINEQACFS